MIGVLRGSGTVWSEGFFSLLGLPIGGDGGGKGAAGRIYDTPCSMTATRDARVRIYGSLLPAKADTFITRDWIGGGCRVLVLAG